MNQLLVGKEVVDIGLEGTSPYLKLRNWGEECSVDLQFNEVGFSILVLGTSLVTESTAQKLEIKTVGEKANFNDAGGLDLYITFKSRPTSNRIVFSYNSKAVSAYRQPPFTEEWKVGEDRGFGIPAVVTETDVLVAKGNVLLHRPEYVVNSIAFFHESKSGDYTALGGKNYRAGKFGSIYRMKATDLKGKWTWVDWSLEKDLLVATLPQAFVNSAAYPVIVAPYGDWFGYNTKGGSTGAEPNSIWATRYFSPASNGTVQSLSAYVKVSASANFKFALYLQSTEALLAQTDDHNETIYDDWITLNTTTNPAVTAGTNYAVALWKNNTSSVWYYDSGAANQEGYVVKTYNSWPDPLAANFGNALRLSEYCTYTPAGGIAYKDISTRFKLTVQGFKDVATRFALQVRGYKDIATRFRLWALNFKDISTRFRLAVRNYLDIPTRFKLIVQSYKDVSTRFKIWVQSYKDTATRFRLSVQGYKDAATRFRLNLPYYQDISTRFKLTIQNYKDLSTRFKLWAQNYKDVATRFKVWVQGYRDVATRFLLVIQSYRDTATRFRLYAQGYKDIGTRFLLQVGALAYKDTSTRFLLWVQSYKNIGTRFRLAVWSYLDIATRFRLFGISYKDAATRFKLTIQAFRDTATRFRLTVQSYEDIATRFRLIMPSFRDVATRFWLIVTVQYRDVGTRFFLYVPTWKELQIQAEIAAIKATPPLAHFEV